MEGLEQKLGGGLSHWAPPLGPLFSFPFLPFFSSRFSEFSIFVLLSVMHPAFTALPVVLSAVRQCDRVKRMECGADIENTNSDVCTARI